MTGMAGGDHLHFTMLVNGQMVNPIEWWDPKWINDRIMRKLRDAGAPPSLRGSSDPHGFMDRGRSVIFK
jgi:hypothetical protein